MFRSLSIKSKIILMVVGVSLISISVITFLGYTSGKQALTERIFAQLTSLRASKAYQIESYFRLIRSQVISLAEDRMVVGAMREFKEAFQDLEGATLSTEWETEITAYYRDQMLPRLEHNIAGIPVLESYLPRGSEIATRYLQYHYIAANPNPLGEKHLLDRGFDDSPYGKAHERIQPVLRNLVDRFGYYDIFLIDIDTGYVVYSVFKETDFATNLEFGPYATSKLAEVLQAVAAAPDRGVAQITDFGRHRPSYNRPAAFIASPIFDEATCLGVLAFQLPVEEIEQVMTSGYRWREDGLGDTGETYLVGPDYLMRSVSRFLIESPEQYLVNLREIGVAQATVDRIRRLKTTILEQKVHTESVELALAGRSDTHEIFDYRRIPVLSSYMPLEIEGLQWVLLSEVDLEEAMRPVRRFSSRVLISGTLIMVLLTLVAILFAEIAVRPLRRLGAQIRRVRVSKASIDPEVLPQDELGSLATEIDLAIKDLRAEAASIAKHDRDNERLLGRVLPEHIVRRLRQDEVAVVDHFESVTVLCADLEGLAAKTRQASDSAELADLLGAWTQSLDEATERHGVEKIKTAGWTYVAVCGLSSKRLDHARCSVDFAGEILQIGRSLSLQHGIELQVRVGIDIGSLVAGTVGHRRLVYDLWGDPAAGALHLKDRAGAGEILVSQQVYQLVSDAFGCDSAGEVALPGRGSTSIWRLCLDPTSVVSTGRQGS